MQNLEYILTLIISVILIVYAWLCFTKYSPAKIFTYFWTFQIVFMLLFFDNYLYFSYSGILYILICLSVFDIGYTIGIITSPLKLISNRVKFNERYVIPIYIIILSLSLLGNLYDLSTTGFSLSSIFNLESFMEMSNQNSVDRYSGVENTGGLIGRIFSINTYATPLIGGMLFHYFKNKLFSIITLLPLIFGGLAQGAKMGIITGSFMWIIGLIVAAQLLNKKINLSFKTLLKCILAICIFFSVLLISMMFRIGHFDLDTFEIVCNKFVSYSLGHLPAFDLWFENLTTNNIEITFGGKTFYGITNSLGLLERKQGVFSEMYVISKEGDSTNVFTVFRLFIEDFGLVCTVLYLLIVGYIIQKIYNIFLLKKSISLTVTLLCSIYFFISWSFATSIFAYATYIAMFFYLYFLLKFLYVKTTDIKFK